jgi:Fe-S cluster biogenesis protein NfuA
MDDLETREQVARIDGLLEQVEGFADPADRETANELVAALLDLYGEGLSRVVERVPDRAGLAEDELVSHLLLLHGIHPQPVEERVRLALAEVRPYLESHGGDVELLAVAEDGVRVRMQGNCNGCPSSAVTLKLAIEEAIHKYAPEIDRIDAEEAEPEPAGPALIQLAPLDPAERLNCPAPAAGT